MDIECVKNTNCTEYVLSYYDTYFYANKEIHAIINYINNTTVKISVDCHELSC